MRKTILLFMVALILEFGTTGLTQTAGPTLKKITAFDLPGPGGKRFDYLTIDQDDHYLISAHLAASQTYVIDLVLAGGEDYLRWRGDCIAALKLSEGDADGFPNLAVHVCGDRS